jgi:hypothetical protein
MSISARGEAIRSVALAVDLVVVVVVAVVVDTERARSAAVFPLGVDIEFLPPRLLRIAPALDTFGLWTVPALDGIRKGARGGHEQA